MTTEVLTLDTNEATAVAQETPAAAAPRMTRGELMRKLYHMNGGTPAWFIRFMRPTTLVGFAVWMLILNYFIMPRFANGKRFWKWDVFWRSNERASGKPTGILLYCWIVFGLTIVFFRSPWMTAAVWGVMAYGDGMATIIGRLAGGPKVPWNASKGIAGTLAFFVFGSVAVAGLIAWNRADVLFLGALPLAAALCAISALVESLPLPWDDNITVPVSAAVALPLLTMVPALAM
ncbi:MAG TPA: hypothetical protein VGF48_23940 [Thermoanaerobaculia bacterium]|jgi:dolichol kinase